MSYKPVAYHPEKKLEKELQSPDFKKALDALDDEFAALDALLSARKQAGLTQEQVAAKMGVSQPSLARVEASLGSRRHSPSLEMLRKYAAAVNCKLEIKLVPKHS
ncbi:helix-turn-helix domain-containing protein [Geomonas azotofigens]|uniref:helix-turn-helix domain-containing protein n=1 Tax=Geomonas azotofigens TaxID=2843196 RepID=UPI001C121A9E|nr:helix-turn-helix transcriptional regulator [Geomonas azotofigens]MBU5613746.1 helix-turn-helix domain-containing protein [Geomonas azotofigens]